MAAIDDMEAIADTLREDGWSVTTPVREESSFDWNTLSLEEVVKTKAAFMNDYFDIIRTCDVLLIANVEKNGIQGYIGSNTLMEAACGHALAKPVVFLNPIGSQPCQLEAMAIATAVLGGTVAGLKKP
ncbi:hypothetical protein [Roseibium algae]|uniref:Nucleoside 2-deoxyribosyltransferase-like protein n=1 Tax=Roseibium algae TaxID=3123038 RepID=A0ABU8TLV6_9HYPH